MENLIVGMDKLTIQPGRVWPKVLDNNPKLRASLAKEGLLVPLLVNSNYEIIDGVDRYVEAQALGWTEIPVTIPETYDEACALLSEARHTAPETAKRLTNLRTWEIVDGLEPLFKERMQERLDAMWGRKRGEKYSAKIRQRGPSRQILAQALGLPSETWVQLIKRTQKAATDPNHEQHKLAKKLWQEVLAETRTPYSAYGILRRDLDKKKLVTNVTSQRTAFKGMLPVADALIASLGALGEISDSITAEEAKAWVTKLRALRRVLTHTQTKLLDHQMEKEKG